jgi:EpsI family protein
MDRYTAALALACLLTAIGALGGHALRTGAPEAGEGIDLDRTPRVIAGRPSRDVTVEDRVRDMLRSDALLMRRYETEGEPPVWVLIDYHRTQRLGATIHSPRICYPGAGWSVKDVETTTRDWGARPEPVRWLRLERGSEEMIALYWYETRWGRSARETALKMDIVRSAVSRRAADAALVRISTPVVAGDRQGARERLTRFLAEGEELLRQELPFGTSGA